MWLAYLMTAGLAALAAVLLAAGVAGVREDLSAGRRDPNARIN